MKPIGSLFISRRLLGLCLFFLSAGVCFAGSATWKQNPSSADWNTDLNWNPRNVPNGSGDSATFSTTRQPSVALSGSIEVSEIDFAISANPFAITIPAAKVLTLSGSGVTNASSSNQRFILAGDEAGYVGGLYFLNNASAGMLTSYDLQGGLANGGIGAYCEFYNHSSASNATFVLSSPTGEGSNGASVFFGDDANADHVTIISQGTILDGTRSGQISFAGNASAGFATIVNEGAQSDSPNGGGLMIFQGDSSASQASLTMKGAANLAGGGGQVLFTDSSTAGNASLFAEDGATLGASGGSIVFYNDSTGGNARLALFGNGILDLRSHNPAFMTFGSIEGSGTALIGAMFFEVGFNNLSTIFSGTLQDDGNGGTLFKEGTGTLTLSGANTYSGGTAIDGGTLLVATKGASPTGTGDISVNQGTLAGTSRLTGGIIVRTGAGEGAFLAPGANGVGTISTGGTLQFGGNAAYLCEIDLRHKRSDSVNARGVTILSNSTFVLIGLGKRRIPTGTAFTVINNISQLSIVGTFDNLADQSTITVNGNRFQANYEGGDGNDLTLTVVP